MRRIALGLAALALAGWAGHAAAGGKGTVVELDGLKSEAPAKWKVQEPDQKLGKFRVYQFQIPGAGSQDAADLTVFYFGQGGGGGVEENLKRWRGMFAGDDAGKVEKFKVGAVPVTTFDVTGTYLFKNPPFAPNAKIERKENYRMVGVIFESEKGPYFMRLTGPAKTVEQNKSDLDRWLKGFK
jgi:hypothetical protein